MIDWLFANFVDRPPITEGWHLIVLLTTGVILVAILHRHVRRHLARIERERAK